MALFDFPIKDLRAYKPEREEPDDYQLFWDTTLEEVNSYPLEVQFAPVDFGISVLDVYDVTFNGYGGQPIKGWFLYPKHHTGKLPCVVEYIGYGGGRNFPYPWLVYPNAGYAAFVMDTRGQGSSWGHGDTPDIAEGDNPQYPGFMTRGVLNPSTYYYRRVFSDAVRAVEAARQHDVVDPARVIAAGGSQGGGITLAVSGLVPDLFAAMPDVPYLCHYRRATEITDTHPYAEISLFLKTHRDKVEQVFNTLSYFDGVNFAARAKAKALFSVGIMDTICPPSTVFAAYNHYAGEKEIVEYSYNNHEGGGEYHTLRKLMFLREIL